MTGLPGREKKLMETVAVSTFDTTQECDGETETRRQCRLPRFAYSVAR